jgi:hypothetical protein
MNRGAEQPEYDDSRSDSQGGTEALIDQLLDNYKIEFRPEVRIKFKKQ